MRELIHESRDSRHVRRTKHVQFNNIIFGVLYWRGGASQHNIAIETSALVRQTNAHNRIFHA